LTDEELDLYFEALGEEMRPLADLIIRLKAQHAAMRARTSLERKAKFALGKQIQRHEDDFARLFNRDDCFAQFTWPDGLVVRFIGPPRVETRDGRMKLRDPGPPRVRPVFHRNET
jgi:hypothetical protein